jgi:hypothetical protein
VVSMASGTARRVGAFRPGHGRLRWVLLRLGLHSRRAPACPIVDERGTTRPSAMAASASVMAVIRCCEACWYLRAAAGLACPPAAMISASVAPVMATIVSPLCLRS